MMLKTKLYILGWAERYSKFRRGKLVRDYPELVESFCKFVLRLIYPKSKWLAQFGIDILGAQTTRQVLGFPQNKKIKHLLDCFDPDCTVDPEKPLKIAICLSGETRTLDHSLPSQQRFFHGHEVDYFCHLWEDDKIPEPLSSLKNSYLNIEKRTNFDALEIASLKDFGMEYISKDLKKPMIDFNMFPMWYGVQQAYQAIEKSGKNPRDYDLICRSRYDTFLIGCLSLLRQMPQANQIVMDYVHNAHGFGDQWALGRPDEMSKYCHLFDYFSDAILRMEYVGSSRSEQICKQYLTDVCKLKVVCKNLGVRLLRKKFIGSPLHRIPLKTPFLYTEKKIAVDNYLKQKYPDIYATEAIRFQPRGARLLALLGIRYHR